MVLVGMVKPALSGDNQKPNEESDEHVYKNHVGPLLQKDLDPKIGQPTVNGEEKNYASARNYKSVDINGLDAQIEHALQDY